MNTANPKQLLNKKQVAKKIAYAVPTIDKKMASGEFPPPDIRMGCSIRWLESTIDNYINSLVEATKKDRMK